MGHDLRFLVRADQEPPAVDRLREHFRSRRWYTDEGDQFSYASDDTGVYFSFDAGGIDAGEPSDTIDDGLVPTCLSFNINYFRPHVFGLEAAHELAAVCDRFSLLVDDPQLDGMGRGAFTRERFLAGWNAGNLFGHRSLLSSGHDGHVPIGHAEGAYSLPAATLERAWRWNYDRQQTQESFGDVFVPKIAFVQQGGAARTFVVWGDAIPVALPDVDLLLMVRDELAPRRLFRRKRDVCLVAMADAEPVLRHGRRVVGPPAHTVFDRVHLRAVEFFRSRAPWTAPLDGLSQDQVLTRELLREAEQAVGRRDPADEGIPRPPDTKPS
ncbi:MAG: hypothetical protein ABW221_02435 [Vicinamibacteria bacterium]